MSANSSSGVRPALLCTGDADMRDKFVLRTPGRFELAADAIIIVPAWSLTAFQENPQSWPEIPGRAESFTPIFLILSVKLTGPSFITRRINVHVPLNNTNRAGSSEICHCAGPSDSHSGDQAALAGVCNGSGRSWLVHGFSVPVWRPLRKPGLARATGHRITSGEKAAHGPFHGAHSNKHHLLTLG